MTTSLLLTFIFLATAITVVVVYFVAPRYFKWAVAVLLAVNAISYGAQHDRLFWVWAIGSVLFVIGLMMQARERIN